MRPLGNIGPGLERRGIHVTFSTMQHGDLRISAILEHGRRIWARSHVTTSEGDRCRRTSYAEVGARAHRLALALARLGIAQGDRVATFMWNTQEHLEAYLAVPSMGAVLHTVNIRLFHDQLAYVINHAEDRVVLVDDSLVPLLAKVSAQLDTVEAFVVVGQGDASALEQAEAARPSPRPVLRYEALLGAEPGEFAWPELDENAPATRRVWCTAIAAPGCTRWPSRPAASARSTSTTRR